MLVDAAGWRLGTRTLCRAGQNALLAYLLAPLLDALLSWLAEFWTGAAFYAKLGDSFETGVARSVGMAVAIIAISAALHKAGVRLKL